MLFYTVHEATQYSFASDAEELLELHPSGHLIMDVLVCSPSLSCEFSGSWCHADMSSHLYFYKDTPHYLWRHTVALTV